MARILWKMGFLAGILWLRSLFKPAKFLFFNLRVLLILMMKQITALVFLFFLINQSGHAQDRWNVEKPAGPSKSISFNTTEGTFMNLDVSPDGKTIVFDLLGDIYKMPIKGGKATLLSGGMAYEVQPRFSPDGKYISYTSDKDGANNIWVMNADGNNQRQVTKERFRLLNNAVWTRDGKYIIARKHFSSQKAVNGGELWMYHISGGFDGVQLSKRKNDQQDLGEPWVSPDGSVYYSENLIPNPVFQYNRDPNGEIYAIKKLDLNTGDIEKVAGGSGGAARPQVSPDGSQIAFVKRDRLNTVLYLQDLQTGEEKPLYTDLSKDQQETDAVFGVYPNFNWLPDNRTIVFYAKGKIMKVDAITLEVGEIPFSADVKQSISEALHFEQPVFKNEFDVKMIRQLATSPDGKKVVFNAAGYLYLKELPDGKPERLTEGTDWEFAPNFSPDGKSVVFVSWNDELRGAVMKFDFKGKKLNPVTSERGIYHSPRFNRKGDLIVYSKGAGNGNLGYSYGKHPGIYTIAPEKGTAKLVIKHGFKPMFSANDDRIYFQSQLNGKKAFNSCDVNGRDVKTHYTSVYATDFIPSPDGRWMAFNELYNVYLTPIISAGSALDLSSENKTLPLKKLTKDAGTDIHWSADSKIIHWTMGSEYFSKPINDAFNFIDEEDSKKKNAQVDTNGISLGLVLASDKPLGRIALKGARIITMEGDEVIDKGTIIINENKIETIGTESSVEIPEDAKVYELNGKTIMPGIVDVNAYLPTSSNGISPQQDWPYFANLAYGVTTVHDPSAQTEMVFSQAEMIKGGLMTGPRLYATGRVFYGAESDDNNSISTLDDLRSHLRRLKAVGAFSVKPHSQNRRDQRQQVVMAARELNMEVLPEGGTNLYTNLSMIADGYTGIERNLPAYPIYKDVTSLWNGSKTAYTPSLIIGYGTQWGENYWYDRTNVWENERLLSYMPKAIVDERSRRRTTSEYGDYGHIDIARSVNQLAKGGTKINLGSHGQLQGLGAHWELWMLAQGGMKPIDCLKAATINGATYLGMDKEIGSLKKGKLADLIVLNGNPLNDIRNSEKVIYTMVNGRLYDASTMNEIGNHEQSRNKFWWQFSKSENYIIPEGEIN